MIDTKEFQKEEGNDELKKKRIQVLVGVWDYLEINKIVDKTRFKLSMPIINDLVEHYITDVEVLKHRYRIDKKIQLHKIAGLLTYLIQKYRPVISTVDSYESEKDIYSNELYAIIHGLSICSEYTQPSVIKSILKEDWFDLWLTDFLYLLHYRNYTAESLVLIYETISFFKFPKNFSP